MRWTRSGLLASCAVVVLALAACGPGGPSEEELAAEAEWTWIQEAKQQLDAKRQEIADLKTQIAAMAAETEPAAAAEGEEGPEATAVDPAARLEELSAEVAALTDEFGQRLVNFINENPMEEGVEPSPRQKELLRLKSSEDMVLAQEWIERGGDYKRAIDIYTTALMFDPDNEELKQALADAEADRYMTPERFAQAKKGMTEDEVRATLGQPNLHNVRDFPEREVTAWFYPTAEDGSAAAVWFQAGKDGVLKSYKLDFEGIKAKEAGAT